MAKLYKEDEVAEKSPYEIVRDTLNVDADGNVHFRGRVGRGSGKGIEIPANEFDKFVDFMIRAREERLNLANEERLGPAKKECDKSRDSASEESKTKGSTKSKKGDEDWV